MSREQMLSALAQEYRIKYGRAERLAKLNGRSSPLYKQAEGMVDGIVVAANAIGIPFYELEEASRR